jgi:hypothetical protein
MWDTKLQQHVLVGGTGDPIPIANIDSFDDMLSNKTVPLASKVCT